MAGYLNKRHKRRINITSPRDIAVLLWIAEQKGFIYDEKLDYKFHKMTYSNEGMDALINGKVNMAVLVETNVAYLGYMNPKNPIKCIASIEERSAENIVIRQKDAKPTDLAGKTIAFLPRSTGHSFLMQFLAKYEIDKKSVNLRPMIPTAMPNALIRGEIDAMSVWQPHVYNATFAMDDMGIDYTRFRNFGIYKSEVVIAVSKDFIVKNRKSCEKFLNALRMAEEYIDNHPDDLRAFLKQKMIITGDDVGNVLDAYRPKVQKISDGYLDNIKVLGEWIGEKDKEFQNVSQPNYNDYVDNSFFS